jgi:hypothetical protein
MPVIFRHLLIAVVLLSSWTCHSQDKNKYSAGDLDLRLLSNTPKKLTESSGLLALNGKIYTHNDSGDKARLFEIDTLGNILETINYEDLNHEDWESITASGEHVYIGDFGNNHGNRNDLVIYKLPLEDIDDENADPEKLKFSYQKQEKFKYKEHNHPYDMEAMHWINGDLYLFSKDWKTFTSTVYKFDIHDKKQKLDSDVIIDTGFVVTDAAYNNDGLLSLIGYDSTLQPYVALVKVSGDKFKLINVLELGSTPSQMEAITFLRREKNHDVYLITSEATNVKIDDNEARFRGAIYLLRIKRK